MITWSIILACVAIWLVELLTSALAPRTYQLLMSTGTFVSITGLTRPWTWFTALFLHAPSVFHVLFNMVALWSVGPTLERMMGHWRFLVLYLISGNWLIAAYGASGALFGLFAAILVVFRRIGADIRSMLFWMAINFALPLLIPDVAWQAHVGGFVVGGALTWLLIAGVPALRRRSFTQRMWIYGSAMVAVLVFISVVCTSFVEL